MLNSTTTAVRFYDSVNVNIDKNTCQGSMFLDSVGDVNVTYNTFTPDKDITFGNTNGDVNITGNYLSGNFTSFGAISMVNFGLNTGWEAIATSYKTKIKDNIIRCTSSSDSPIYLLGYRDVDLSNNKTYGGDSWFVTSCLKCTFSKNEIYNYTTYGIYLGSVGFYYNGRHTINDNILTSPTATGGIFINFSSTFKVDSCFITNNDVKYSCASPTTNGIQTANGTNIITVAGNRTSGF
jgi:hypothetical protein